MLDIDAVDKKNKKIIVRWTIWKMQEIQGENRGAFKLLYKHAITYETLFYKLYVHLFCFHNFSYYSHTYKTAKKSDLKPLPRF
jgi:hypothetical protein